MFEQGHFITAEIRIKPESDLLSALQAIEHFCLGMNSEPGCSMAFATQDKQDPRRLILWERYEDKAAFEQHLQATHTQAFIALGLTELVQAFETQLPQS